MAKKDDRTEESDPKLFERPPIEVVERYLQHPFGVPSTPIELKEPGWTCLWVNARLRPNRVWEMQQKARSPVRVSELKDFNQVGDFTDENGFVVRGIHGEERLYKIPTDVYERERRLMAEIRTANLRNPGRQRDEVAQAAASKIGGEAADFLATKTRVVGSVVTTRERIEQLDED